MLKKGVSISGSLLFEDGTPASGVQMRLCYGQCFPAMVDENGQGSYTGKGEGKYSLQAVKLGDASFAVPSTIVLWKQIPQTSNSNRGLYQASQPIQTLAVDAAELRLANNLIVFQQTPTVCLGRIYRNIGQICKVSICCRKLCGTPLGRCNGRCPRCMVPCQL